MCNWNIGIIFRCALCRDWRSQMQVWACYIYMAADMAWVQAAAIKNWRQELGNALAENYICRITVWHQNILFLRPLKMLCKCGRCCRSGIQKCALGFWPEIPQAAV